MDRAELQQLTKQALRRTIGEPHVGKRIKMRRLNHVMPALGLHPTAILDAGAEDAAFVYWLADRYPQAIVTAVDIDASAIEACVRARPARYKTRVQFRIAHFADLDPASFDLITAFDVLEHIDDDRGAAADLTRALRPGGTLLVHVPRDRWVQTDGTTHRLPDAEAWRINPGHVRQGYSPETMTALLKSAGLVVDEFQTWVGSWGTRAHQIYDRLEHPAPLRLLTLPVTDAAAAHDRRHPDRNGNTVFVHAHKPA